MAYYVYLIQSLKDQTFYKGSSERPLLRLQEHNAGLCAYTKNKMPWQLVYVEELPSKKEMIIREKKLKRGNKDYFQTLIASPKNILHQLQHVD